MAYQRLLNSLEVILCCQNGASFIHLKNLADFCRHFTTTLYILQASKNTPPHFHTSLRQKWGGGICSNFQFISCIGPPRFSTIFNMHDVNNHVDCRGFPKKMATSLNVCYGKSVLFVLILSQW